MARKKHNEYYAVKEGRVNKPTIFSSWGDAHPRVTGCHAVHKAFVTIEEAREYMKDRGVTEPREIIKEGAGETSPLLGSQAFYAVAYGHQPGIYPYWHGGTEPEINLVSGACHKRFRTLAQAEAFIEDWKQTFADLYRGAIKEALDQGFRPHNMKLSVEEILHEHGTKAESTDMVDELNLDRLTIEHSEE